MEVTLVHPQNPDGKVVVTNQIQYDAFKSRGFVDVKTDKKDDLEAAQTPALRAHPTADASKETPEQQEQATEKKVADSAPEANKVVRTKSDEKDSEAKSEAKNASRKETK